MIRIALTLLLTTVFISSSLAQSPGVGETIENEFKVTEVPEKWKNESAVIIGMKEEYLFRRQVARGRTTAGVNIKEYVHKRIKLQDKNAVEKYSTFYYVTIGAEGKAVYKVIKSSGKEVDIDMKSAIEEEQDIPEIYKPIYYKMKVKSMKIAIPDLEVGDIVDYTINSNLDWDMKTSGINFTPFIFSLSNNYPTMYQQYRFTMANGMKVKYRSYNGAPNIKFDAKASVYGERESYLSYYFLDKDREKSLDERWSFELRSTPSVKFRVVFLDYDPGDRTLGEATVDRSGLDIEQMYRGYAGAALYNTPVVTSMVAYTTQYLVKKKSDGLLKNEADIIKECYYCLRKVFLEMYYKGPVHSELEKYFTGKKLYKKILAAEAKNEKKEEKEDEIRMNSATFATALRSALAAQGISSELFVYVPRKLGTWRDAIFLEELDFVMKVKIKGKAYYLEAFNNFDAFATPYSYLENAEGYSIRYDEVDSYYKSSIPATPATDNLSREEYVVNFTDAMEVINVERTSSYLGTEKTPLIGKANLDREYLNADFKKYYAEPLSKDKKKDKDAATPVASTASYEYPDKEEQVKERKTLFEKELKTDHDVDQYTDFELISDGRSGDTALLKYKEKFSLKKLISKAGKNYIFEAGKLIGGQIKLEQSEMKERQTDIWIPSARVIENSISINIPAGYTVDGLQDLNMNIDNPSGSFISSATLADSKVLITTKKVYKNNYDKKEAWPNYIAFLEPAYKLSQAKIVLKKK
ncbi:MAG TPA: DUF3857 domain-containing protein [Ferruginibacter sp.]|nr:DUF3857 domain-containing protein [Ferruginibacter sp.]